MDVRELRIGNLIDRGDYICKVNGIMSYPKNNNVDDIITEPLNYEGERFVNLYYKPIPLTKEWLFKFGFIYYEEVYQFILEGIDINYYKKTDKITNDYSWIDEDGFYAFDLCLKIKYVHQLQNLYYTLTGGELYI